MSTTRATRLLAVGFAGAALLSACSGSAGVGTKQVARGEVESTAAHQLAAQVNQPTPKVNCPNGLEAKVGATLECTLTAQGDATALPVHIVVESVDNGTAHFTAQVGQAVGGGDKAGFCADNAVLDKATAVATQPSDLIAIFKDNEDTLARFRTKAPAEIINDAGTLAKAANDAVASGDASNFLDPVIVAAGKKVDGFCGQNSDGSPATGPTPTTVA